MDIVYYLSFLFLGLAIKPSHYTHRFVPTSLVFLSQSSLSSIQYSNIT